MARPRKFDEQATLQAVTEVFWHKGFEGTSINDLIHATGLRPGSLYAAFCNKQQLFLRSLDFYAQKLEQEIEAFFNEELNPKQGVMAFFKLFIDFCQASPQGCFLVNTLFEANLDDQAILDTVKKTFNQLEERFETLFSRAQQQGTLNPEISPSLAAKTMMSAIYGLRGYHKIQQNITDIEALQNLTVNTLFKRH